MAEIMPKQIRPNILNLILYTRHLIINSNKRVEGKSMKTSNIIINHAVKILVILGITFLTNLSQAIEFKKPTSSTISKNKTVYKPLPKLKINKVKQKEFVVPAALAWAEAKRHGFKFYPAGATGIKDGLSVMGSSFYKNDTNAKQEAKNTSRFSAGILMEMGTLVNYDLFNLGVIDSYALLHLFQGKRLRNLWKIKSIDFGGTYSMNKRITTNSRSAHCIVKVSIRGSGFGSKTGGFASFKEVVLIGPENGRWQDAFDVR